MDRLFSMYAGVEKVITKFLSKNLSGGDHLRVLGVDGTIILK
jgi:hypothetical protein